MTLQVEIDFELRQAARLQLIAADASVMAMHYLSLFLDSKKREHKELAIAWQIYAKQDYFEARQRHFEAMNIR